MLGTTFGGNHLACAAALAVLEVMESENLMQQAADNGAYLMERLQGVEVLQNVRGKGLMVGFDVPAGLKDLKSLLLNEYKIFTGEAKPHVIRLLPALNLGQKGLETFLAALQQAVSKLRSEQTAQVSDTTGA